MPEKSSDLDREYRECVRRLYSIAPSFQVVGASGYHPGLDNMRAFAAFLGNPHLSLRAVHVAGTNGKGSVAHMLASALACARPGTSIGLYTSPHLVDFRERIKTVSIDGSGDGRCFSEIGKEDVVDFLRRAADFINERRPSFFEITTAMAFDYFHRRGVDMAVIETGLGGRLDSTNIIVPELSVITSIGLDHKNILGDTIEKIAAEKAGIIKPGVPVVAGDLPEEAMKIVAGRAEAAGSDLYRAGDLCGDCADAAEAAAKLEARGERPDVIIVDPPRKGCAPELLHTVVQMNPERMVYVSCDPATLARDMRIWADLGYVPQELTPVDMFPRTNHVECVTLFKRKSGNIL